MPANIARDYVRSAAHLPQRFVNVAPLIAQPRWHQYRNPTTRGNHSPRPPQLSGLTHADFSAIITPLFGSRLASSWGLLAVVKLNYDYLQEKEDDLRLFQPPNL